ncbi:hypothetical protein [Gracilimonas sp.]|uniref:hypothetical protein n=1 Tax=Gracilimonas sp. TaxID=1974203 RepID=UPI003BA86BF7
MKKLVLVIITVFITSCSDFFFEREFSDSIQSLRSLSSDQQIINFSNFIEEDNWSYLLILQTGESVPLEAYNEFGEMNNYFGFEIENMSTNKMRFYLLDSNRKPLRTIQIDKAPKNSEHLNFESCTDTLRYGIMYYQSETSFKVSFNSSDLGEGTAFLEPHCQ